MNFKIIHAPGHTPGHIVLFEEAKRKLFGGDCLFAASIGRTDLPGGNAEQLLNSIHEKILPLGDDVRVYTGHGAETVLGTEKSLESFSDRRIQKPRAEILSRTKKPRALNARGFFFIQIKTLV